MGEKWKMRQALVTLMGGVYIPFVGRVVTAKRWDAALVIDPTLLDSTRRHYRVQRGFGLVRTKRAGG